MKKRIPTMIKVLLCTLLILVSVPLYAADDDYRQQVEKGLEYLQKNYDYRTGLWKDAGWWNCANILTMLVDYSKSTGDETYFPIIENTFKRAQRRMYRNFINEYYDDEAWWAIAWVGAFELTGKTEYLEAAEYLFLDISKSWSDTHGGGVFWKKDSSYKNSIANNLFTLLALRLNAHRPEKRIEGETYLEWAKEDWRWYSETGMINQETGMIEDGLRRDGTPNRGQYWTYNQGVVIAILVEFYKIDKNEEHLTLARKIADSTIKRLINAEGILRERNEPNTGSDGSQFKGIFMRHLYSLYEVTNEETYRKFIDKNSDSIWNNRSPEGGFGVCWDGKGEMLNSATQGSALDALVARIRIKR